MNEERNMELRREIFRLKREIEFNERIRCPRVAARYRRELERLIEENHLKTNNL